MPDFSVFGGCLRTDFPLPELPPARQSPTWAVTSVAALRPVGELRLLGTKLPDLRFEHRLYQHEFGFRLEFRATGSFDILENGSTIEWLPGADSHPDIMLLVLVGPVLAVAFHAAGLLCLHGSAVELGDGGICILAPKHSGKSTLARALLRAGGRLATDDLIVASAGDPPELLPGLHQVRLWGDSAAQFVDDDDPLRTDAGGKQVLTTIERERLVLRAVPIAAVYLLLPVTELPDGAAVSRVRVPPLPATLALVANNKNGPLLGDSEAPVLLDRASNLARHAEVFTLAVVRDFTRLDEVAAQLLAWHGGAVESRREAVAS